MALLELTRLRKQFGELVAVDDLDLSIDKGEIRGLIGPNGSGKTTAFNLIAGYFLPTRGKVIWQGHNITGLSQHTRVKRGIARTFQANILFQDLTALQNVVVACHTHCGMGLLEQFLRTRTTLRKEKALEDEAVSLLETMGIAHVRNKIAKDLPWGHQRCLSVAMALATGPKLLLLDEPITGMDPTESREMMDKIRKMRDSGLTILLVEHNMKSIMVNCEKITVLNFGKKIAEGSPEEISRHKDVIEAYLGGG